MDGSIPILSPIVKKKLVFSLEMIRDTQCKIFFSNIAELLSFFGKIEMYLRFFLIKNWTKMNRSG